MNNCIRPDPSRAERFGFHVALRYRAHGEKEWHEGLTQNISHTGVLFWAPYSMEAHTPIEIRFAMPVKIGSKRGAEVLCQGEIVRTLPPASSNAQPSLAARILEYRFVRGREVLVA